MSKACSKCKIDKELSEFGKCSKAKDCLKSACKECLRYESRKYMQKRMLTDRDLLYKRTRAYKAKKFEENPEYYKEEYKKHQATQKASARKFYAKNKEQCLEGQKAWRKNNPEAGPAATKRWRKNNPERSKEIQKISSSAYRARKSDAIVQNFTFEQLDQRMSMFDYQCCYCGGPFEQVDHLIPLSKDGRHCLSNLRPSCKQCNNRKFNKSPFTWFAEIERNK